MWTSLKSSSHDSLLHHRKKARRTRERERVSKTEITIFYNLISEVISHLFAAFFALEASHWVQHTLKGKELHKSMKARGQGSLEGISEALYHQVYFLLQLAYPNYYNKSNGAVCSFGIGETSKVVWTFYPMHSVYSLGAEAEVPNVRLFVTEEIRDDISKWTEFPQQD